MRHRGQEPAPTYHLGVDVGGTFTDFLLVDEASGERQVLKCLTTPEDPARAILEGLTRLAAGRPDLPERLQTLIHGTTLAINAIVERAGARTGLITTRGFRDVLELRRGVRPDMYDIFGDARGPLVSRSLRREIAERVTSAGRVLIPPDRAEVAGVVRGLVEEGIESLAVCLLHAYAHPAHERVVAEVAADVAPALAVSLSSEVLPEVREYERTSTTVINAYVKPLVGSYLEKLQGALHRRGFRASLLLMLSGGGVAAPETARRFPVRVIESGPVAGAVAARYYGELAGAEEILAFDMGGTTAKGCVIRHGTLPVTSELDVDRAFRFKKGSGLPVAVPTIDLVEIGAGGGSLCAPSPTGAVQVGPRSAGAEPGFIGYGRGGREPTGTDADLVLGYLDPAAFLGGEMRLDREAAAEGLRRRLAEPLGLSVEQAAWGVHAMVNETMAAALRMHMAERGADASRCALVAFGGAGPVHACGLAHALGLSRILVPPAAGVMAAFGMLVAPVAYEVVRTFRVPLDRADPGQAGALYLAMEGEARGIVEEAAPAGGLDVGRAVDLCYRGQGSTVRVPLPEGVATFDGDRLGRAFHAAYAELYGYAYPDFPVELFSLRLEARAHRPALGPHRPLALGESGARAVGRRAFCPIAGGYRDYTVHARAHLAPGARVDGPALIEEPETTTLVTAEFTATVEAAGLLSLTRKAAA